MQVLLKQLKKVERLDSGSETKEKINGTYTDCFAGEPVVVAALCRTQIIRNDKQTLLELFLGESNSIKFIKPSRVKRSAGKAKKRRKTKRTQLTFIFRI